MLVFVFYPFALPLDKGERENKIGWAFPIISQGSVSHRLNADLIVIPFLLAAIE